MKNWLSILIITMAFSALVTGCEPEPEKVVVNNWTETQPKLVKFMIEKGDTKYKIKEEKFYEDGTREYVGTFDENGQRHGEWKYYYPNGNLWSLGEYEHGLNHGKKEVHWPDGVKRYEGQFKDDVKSGKWIFYDTDGSVLQQMDFSKEKPAKTAK